MLKLVNHFNEFILSRPSRAPLSLFTLPEETETIHLGIEGILMMNIIMSSFATQSSEVVMNMQLGGGKKNMQLGDQLEMFREEKDLKGAEWIIKVIEKLKMMLEVTWCRTE